MDHYLLHFIKKAISYLMNKFVIFFQLIFLKCLYMYFLDLNYGLKLEQQLETNKTI
jgi:hypothetical protein